jgi:hypothetical protein
VYVAGWISHDRTCRLLRPMQVQYPEAGPGCDLDRVVGALKEVRGDTQQCAFASLCECLSLDLMNHSGRWGSRASSRGATGRYLRPKTGIASSPGEKCSAWPSPGPSITDQRCAAPHGETGRQIQLPHALHTIFNSYWCWMRARARWMRPWRTECCRVSASLLTFTWHMHAMCGCWLYMQSAPDESAIHVQTCSTFVAALHSQGMAVLITGHNASLLAHQGSIVDVPPPAVVHGASPNGVWDGTDPQDNVEPVHGSASSALGRARV